MQSEVGIFLLFPLGSGGRKQDMLLLGAYNILYAAIRQLFQYSQFVNCDDLKALSWHL